MGQVTVNHAELFDTVREMYKITRGHVLEVLHKIEFRSYSGRNNLRLRATDLEIYETRRITADMDEKIGPVLLDAKLLYKILKPSKGTKAAQEEVIIKTTKDGIELTIEGMATTLQILPGEADDFPDFPKCESMYSEIKLDGSFLGNLKFLESSISSDDARVNLNSVYMERGRMVSTDGHRLHMCAHDYEMDASALIPTCMVNATLRTKIAVPLLRIETLKNGNQLTFSGGGWEISSKEVSGEFPPIDQVIPKQFEREVVLETNVMKKALDRVSRVNADDKVVVFMFDREVLKLQATCVVGNSTTTVPIKAERKKDGREVKSGFNYNYIQDALSTSNSKLITIKIGDDGLSPMVIAFEDEPDKTVVVMPTRL